MATTYTITARNEEFSGEVAGVTFSRGVGKAVDLAPHLKAYFERHGYDVEEKSGRRASAKPDPKPDPKTPADPSPDGNGPKE